MQLFTIGLYIMREDGTLELNVATNGPFQTPAVSAIINWAVR